MGIELIVSSDGSRFGSSASAENSGFISTKLLEKAEKK